MYAILEYEWEEVAPPSSLCLVCLCNKKMISNVPCTVFKVEKKKGGAFSLPVLQKETKWRYPFVSISFLAMPFHHCLSCSKSNPSY